MKNNKIDVYCTCGFAAHLTFKGTATPQVKQRIVSRLLDAGHRGDGHAPCDKATATKVQREKPGVVFFD